MKKNLKETKSHDCLNTNSPLTLPDSEATTSTAQNSQTPPKTAITSKILIPVLLLLIQLNIGSYYSYDVPQQLATNFTNKFKLTQIDIEFLYSIWALFALPMGLFSGLIVKKLSPLVTVLLSSFMIYVSCVLTNLGIETEKYIYILIARALYGFASEPLMVAQATIISDWFTGRYLSLANGLSQTVNNLGLVASYYLTSLVYVKSRNMFVPFMYSSFFNLFSVLCGVLYSYYDLRYLGIVKGVNHEKMDLIESLESKSEMNRSSLGNSTGVIEMDLEEVKSEEINCTYLRDMKDLRIWLSIFMFNCAELCYFMFTNFSTEFMIKRFKFDILEAKNILLVLPLITIFFIPVYSIISVKRGMKIKMFGFGFLMACLGYIFLAVLPVKKTYLVYFPIFLIGQFWSIFGAVAFSSIVIATPTRSIPLSLGFSFFSNDVFLSTVPLIFGQIVKNDDIKGYQNALYLLIGLSCLGIGLSIWNFIVDLKKGGILELPENGEKAKKLKILMDSEKLLDTNVEKNLLESSVENGESLNMFMMRKIN